jgi:PAS domain S-box-containing protein
VKLSVRFKLTAFTLGIVLLVGGTISGVSIPWSSQRILAQADEEARGVTAILAADIADALYFTDVGSIRRHIRTIRFNPDVRSALVADAEGMVVQDGTEENALRGQPWPQELHRRLVGADGWITWRQGERLLVGGPIRMPDGQHVGYLAVEFSLADAYQLLRDTTRTGLFLTLVCVVLGGGLAFLLGGRVGRPLRAIVRACRQIGTGNLDVNLRIPREDELGTLAESINQMAGDLQRTTVSREFLDDIIGSMAESLIVLTPDATIRRVNPATLRLLGYAEGELVDRHISVICADMPIIGEPANAGGPREGIPTAESTYVAKDGRTIPVIVSASVMRDTRGGLRGFVCLAQDITGRKRAEEQLRLQSRALDAAVSAIVITDRQGRVTWANPAFTRLTGYTLEEAFGQDLRLLKSARQDPAAYQRLWEAVLRGEVWRGELFNRRKDGSEYLEGQTITPVRDAAGEITHFIAIKQDITQRMRAEQVRQALYQASLHIQEALDLPERLNRLLRTAQTVLELDRVNILLADEGEEWLHAVASLGVDEPLEAIRVPIGPEGGAISHAYSARQPIIWQGPGPLPEALKLKPPYDRIKALRSQVFAVLPLVVQGRSIGVLGADRRHSRRPLEPGTGELLQLFATQAALAIEQSRLFQREQDRRRQLEAVRAVGEEITRELDLSTLLNLIHRRAAELVGGTSGVLYLWDEEAQLLIPRAWHGLGDWVGDLPRRLDDGVTGTVAQRREGMIVNDYRRSPYRNPIFAEKTRATATLVEPLLYRDRLLGVISVNHEEAGRAFSEQDRELVTLFASQAAIAIENARLFEREQARRRQVEAVRAVGQEITREMALGSLLDLIIRRATELVAARAGIVFLLDEPAQVLVPQAWHGLEAWVGEVRLRLGEGLAGTVAQRREGKIVNDYRTSPYAHPAFLERTDLTASVAEPLLHGDRLLGVITIANSGNARPFTEQNRATLALFAAQAAIAIENARLYVGAEKRAAEFTTLREVGQAITSRLELPAVLEAIVAGAMQLLGTQHTQITLWDEERQILRYGAALGTEAEKVRTQVFELGKGVNGTVALTRQPLVLDDYGTSPYALPEFSYLAATITVPVVFGDRLLGVLHAHTTQRDRRFTSDDLRMFQMFGAQAAIAIENARLFEATEQRAAEVSALREIGQAITARLELPAVLDAVVAGALRLLGSHHAQIILWDEATQSLRFGAALGAEAERVRKQKFTLGKGINGTVALTRMAMLLEDYQGSPYVVPECFDVVSTVTVPVLFGDRLLGVLHSHTTTQGKRFTRRDLRRLEELAAQAAIAIENARLYEAERQRTEELQAVMEVSREVVGERPLPAFLREVVARAIGLTRAHSGILYLWDDGEEFLVPSAWINVGAYMATMRYRLGQGIAGAVAEAGQGLICNNCSTHPQRDPELLRHVPLQACMAAPVKSRDRNLGVLVLNHTVAGQQFGWEDFHLLEAFASQMAIAIENARLYEEIRQHSAVLEERVQERTRELEVANQQLAAASHHKSEFLANMSHELRTPLNSVMGFSQLLLEQKIGPLTEKQARFLGHVYNSGKHLLTLISDILDLSKVEAGKLELHPEPLPVARSLEDILVIARGLAHKKAQRVEVDIESGLPPLHADPVRFKQILFNLLSNAVKFTPDAGTITLTARQASGIRREAEPAATSETGSTLLPPNASPRADFLEIRVTDTGAGIRREDLPRLFQEFVQLEATARQHHEGSGLGLALTKRLVELHGGQIWAESEGEGKGSTFTVVLPHNGSGGASDRPE